MDFESPDVMKDFPGLYASETHKNSNDDGSDDDKHAKKDSLIGKRKEKKDKKDKERGYAALEGESSAEEFADSRSPSKSKKSKSFKFTSKSKDKREKSRDKEKDSNDKKKDKKNEKEKHKWEKKERKVKCIEDCGDASEALPIFGVSLDVAVKRSRCHDGVDIPLPVRLCVDHVQAHGLLMEGVYKVSGTKSKVIHLRKLFNNRCDINLPEYDVPTVTSLLKMFLRSLPEPLFTTELQIRFEEAGAILNAQTREKHLKILVDNLPPHNKTLLSWLFLHFTAVEAHEKTNKMNRHHLAAALSSALHTSVRLFLALLYHCQSLFPSATLFKYVPPLKSGEELPSDLDAIRVELTKQESLLTQIHSEMSEGFISKEREELLWEVQRIITQLKRKLKTTTTTHKETTEKTDCDVSNSSHENVSLANSEGVEKLPEVVAEDCDDDKSAAFDRDLLYVRVKNSELLKLKERLLRDIEVERNETVALRGQLKKTERQTPVCNKNSLASLDEIIPLLRKENQILEIKKIQLARQIMEQFEICIELRARCAVLEV